MRTSKNQIEKNTSVEKKANKLTLQYGMYKVRINENSYETDVLGHLFSSKKGIHFQEWNDTGITCENKKQFIESVFNLIND